MPFPMLLRSPRIRRGIAASAVVLSAGGLVLFRASGGSASTLTTAIMAATPTRAPFSGPGAHGAFSLSQSRVFVGADRALYGEVNIVADGRERADVHAPLAIAVVLDTSGSMDGEKIEDAKNSVVRLLRDMKDDDEVAVVRYSDDAEVIQDLARVGTVRDEVVRRLSELHAGGGTAIPKGLKSGMNALEDAGRGRVKRVVLVSDGLDSTRAEAERLARESSGKGITVSSLGIGLDFDESYMSGVASIGHGNFGFVKDSGALAKFLERELHETAATTIENAHVRITLPPGVELTHASGAEVKTLANNQIELEIGSLFAGDERRVVLEMRCAMDLGDMKSFATTAAWNVVGGPSVDAPVASLQIVAASDAREAELSRDNEVNAQAVSVVASRKQLAAAEAYQRGDTAAADAIIADNLNELKAAQKGAPAPMATALDRQWQAYDGTKRTFATAPPKSPVGNAATKTAVEKDVSNLGRESF